MEDASAIESKSPMQSAIDCAGSQSELARRIGSTQGSVWRWLNGTPIAAEFVIPIENATGVSRHDLRPDLYPREAAPPAPVAALDDLALRR